MSAFGAALGLFTVVPVAPTLGLDRRMAGRAMAAFPWVGLALGIVAGGALVVLGYVAPSPLPSVVALGILAAATGALHLDGLADTADGLGSRTPADEALVIMRKSDIGPMGVVSLLFAVLLALGSLHAVAGRSLVAAGAAVALGAMVSRAAVVVATVSRESARASGFGALFVGVTSAWSAMVNVALVLAVAVGLGVVAREPMAFGVAAAVSLGLGWAWSAYLRRRLGGLTGDTFGSVLEVTQVAVWFLLALA